MNFISIRSFRKEKSFFFSFLFSFRYQTLFNEYKQLEEEFRDALKIEQRRFQEV